jgi:hypothetical protein
MWLWRNKMLWDWITRKRGSCRPAITSGKIHGCLVWLLGRSGRVDGRGRWAVILAYATKLCLGWPTDTDAGLTTVTEGWELLTGKWCWGELAMTGWCEWWTVWRMDTCYSKSNAGLCSTMAVVWRTRRREEGRLYGCLKD